MPQCLPLHLPRTCMLKVSVQGGRAASAANANCRAEAGDIGLPAADISGVWMPQAVLQATVACMDSCRREARTFRNARSGELHKSASLVPTALRTSSPIVVYQATVSFSRSRRHQMHVHIIMNHRYRVRSMTILLLALAVRRPGEHVATPPHSRKHSGPHYR